MGRYVLQNRAVLKKSGSCNVYIDSLLKCTKAGQALGLIATGSGSGSATGAGSGSATGSGSVCALLAKRGRERPGPGG